MRPFVVSITIISFVLVSSYTDAQSPEWKGKIEVVDGIECIHNTQTPLYPDKTVTFVEELTIGGKDQDGDVILYEPGLLTVDDNENIYISEWQDQVIKVFGSDGKYIRTIGAKGEGPGEFQFISSLAFTKDGKLVVTDLRARRTSFFDSSGQFLRSFKWLIDQYNFIMIKSSSYVFGERAFSGVSKNGFYYVEEMDFEGKVIRSYAKFYLAEPLIARSRGGGTSYTSLPVAHSSIFAGDTNREWVYHCLNNKYIIEVYNTSGKLFRKIDRPYEPVPFTKKDAEKYKAKYVGSPSEAIRKAVREMKMPEVKNVASRMHVDDDSRLWIRTNEEKEVEYVKLTAYDIYNSDGIYFARIWTPVLPYLFKDGKMYRSDVDSGMGYQSIKRYKVIWN